jgi:hypothetical protein
LIVVEIFVIGLKIGNNMQEMILEQLKEYTGELNVLENRLKILSENSMNAKYRKYHFLCLAF